MIFFATALGCGSTSDWKPAYEAWKPGSAIPDFPLVDQRGRAFHLAELGDGWVLLGFVYTRCHVAEACPLTTERMAETERLWRERGGPPLRLLSVSIDPEHDTPETLRKYAVDHGADEPTWTFATGDPEVVARAMPSLWNVAPRPDGDQLVHEVAIALLRPGLLEAGAWTDDFRPELALAYLQP